MIRRMPERQPPIDAKITFNLFIDLPEFGEDWRKAINDLIYLEQSDGVTRLPDQTYRIDVSGCDVVPRVLKGSKNGIEWIAFQDYDASYELADGMRKYVAVYFVQEDR